MSCYCTNSWDSPYGESYYHEAYPHTNHYGAQIARDHCTPSVAGVSLCVEKGAGGTAKLKYRGITVASTTIAWGEPLLLEGGALGVKLALTATPHRTGCIDNIKASACYTTHCTGLDLPQVCLGELF